MTFPDGQTSAVDLLMRHAEAGTLRLHDGVAHDCERACDAMIDALDHALRNAQRLSTITAYGTLTSAQQLGRKFETKALGPGGLQDVLQQHIDTVLQLRDLFEKAGRAYRDADANTAATLASHTPDG